MKKMNNILLIRKYLVIIFLVLVAFILNSSKCDRESRSKKCSNALNTGSVRAFNRTGPQIYGVYSVFVELTNIYFSIETFEGYKNIKIKSVIPESNPPHYCNTIPLHFTNVGSELPADPFGTQAYRGVVRIFWESEETGIKYSSYGAAHIRISYYVPDHPQFSDDQMNNLDCYQLGDPVYTSCMTANIKMYSPFPDAEPEIVVTGKCVNFALPDMNEFTYDFEDVKICANYSDPYYRYPKIYPIESRTERITMTNMNTFYFNALIDKGTFPINEVSLFYKFRGQNFRKKTISNWRLLLDKGIVNTDLVFQDENIESYYWEVNYGGGATDIIQSDILSIVPPHNIGGSYFEYFEHLFKSIYTDNSWEFLSEYMCSSSEVNQP